MTARGQAWWGGVYAAAAFGFWGFVPIYWKAVGVVPPLQMLGHRTLWAAVLLWGAMLAAGRWKTLRAVLRDRRRFLVLLGTAALLAINWFVFIWAVGDGRIVEASLGYFINPLGNVLLGVVFLRERLRRLERWAVVLAGVGVLYLVIQAGVFPWVSLVLALTFGLYGLIRKVAPIGVFEGLTIETGILAPGALAYLVFEMTGGRSPVFGAELGLDVLVVTSGLVTVLPLLLFAAAAKRLRYATVGFFQYLAPTGQLLLGVLVYGEAFTRAHGIAFLLIWAALVLYTFQGWKSRDLSLPPPPGA